MNTEPREPESLSQDPSQRGVRADVIRSTLQDEIESGKLVPGTPLDVRALASRFEVSRTPVREALQQLAASELVRIVPRQGACVARLSVKQVRAIMESVGEMESIVAKLAARRVDDDFRVKLDHALKLCQFTAQRNDPEAYSAANNLFHEAIYAGSHNPYLAELIRKARSYIHRYRRRDFHTKTRIVKSVQDHLRIANAIRDGDEALACECMLAHVPAGSTGFSELLARIPTSFFESDSA